MAKEYPSRENVSIVSSGNFEQDEAHIDRFLQSDRLIAEGMCPNKCGPMNQADAQNRECPSCGFVHYKSTAFRSK